MIFNYKKKLIGLLFLEFDFCDIENNDNCYYCFLNKKLVL